MDPKLYDDDDDRGGTGARAYRAELQRRLAEVAGYDDAVFGKTGRVDVAVTVALFILLPALAAWLCR